MTSIYALVISGFTLTSLAMIVARRNATLTCPELIRRLHPHQLSGLDRYLDEDEPTVPDSLLWQSTGRRTGLYRRWRNRTVLLKLCQIRASNAAVSPEELSRLRDAITCLSRASLVAALLSAIRPVARAQCDAAVYKSFRLYAEVADTTYTFLALGGVPLCARKLGSIL